MNAKPSYKLKMMEGHYRLPSVDVPFLMVPNQQFVSKSKIGKEDNLLRKEDGHSLEIPKFSIIVLNVCCRLES